MNREVEICKLASPPLHLRCLQRPQVHCVTVVCVQMEMVPEQICLKFGDTMEKSIALLLQSAPFALSLIESPAGKCSNLHFAISV